MCEPQNETEIKQLPVVGWSKTGVDKALISVSFRLGICILNVHEEQNGEGGAAHWLMGSTVSRLWVILWISAKIITIKAYGSDGGSYSEKTCWNMLNYSWTVGVQSTCQMPGCDWQDLASHLGLRLSGIILWSFVHLGLMFTCTRPEVLCGRNSRFLLFVSSRISLILRTV